MIVDRILKRPGRDHLSSVDIPQATYNAWFNLGLDPSIGVGEFFESIIEAIYTTVVSAGDSVIDGGANRGRHLFTLSSLVGETGCAVGFEAIAPLAEQLSLEAGRRNFLQTVVVGKALGVGVGATEFVWVSSNDGFSGLRQRDGISDNDKSSIMPVTVEITTIDVELAKLSVKHPVRFIKLDLEGGEYDALRGGFQTLLRDKPLVVLENGRESAAQLYGHSKDQWFEFFRSADYKTFDLFGRDFVESSWNVGDLPWYTIAAGRSEDISFVKQTLPLVVELVAIAYNQFKLRLTS